MRMLEELNNAEVKRFSRQFGVWFLPAAASWEKFEGFIVSLSLIQEVF